MRLSALLAAAAIAVAPSFASAAVMVAHFEGGVGGIHSTFSTRFGYPPLTVFSGPFVAEVTYDTEAGAVLSAPPGAERRNAASIQGAWIEWSGVRLDIPSAEFGEVIATSAGFSFQAIHFINGVVFDSLTLTAAFSGAAGHLESPIAEVTATGGGHLQAISDVTGVYTVDLDGDCNFASCQGMQLEVNRFTLSEYVDPGSGGVPEPGAWALMILGLGGVGMALRRRRAALA